MDKTTAAIKRQRFTTAYSPLSTLPFHLLEEILCRFPVKFLLQLQCVCKSWKSLISDNPNFAKKHLHMSLSDLHQSHHHLIINSIDTFSTYCDLPISSVFDTASKVIIAHAKPRSLLLNMSHNNGAAGSCHGIICVPIEHRVLFWNPSIGKHKLSPSFKYARYYGFGYDDLNDKYKVVGVSCYVDGSVIKTKVMVHTMGTNCWRRIQDFPCGRGLPIEKPSKFVGGSVHWLTSKIKDKYSCLFFVVSLDLRSESYQEILQPDYGEVNVVTLTLGVSRDCLCIFARTKKYIDVWCMKEYGKKESWSKLFTIPFTTNLCYYHDIEVAYIYEDEQVLLLCTRVYDKPRLVVYDSKSDTFKRPGIESDTFKHPGIENLNERMVPIDYVESLVTPCS